MKEITNTSKTPRLDWLFGGNHKAIEDQEAQGQKELVESIYALPKKVNYPRSGNASEYYKKMGIKVFETPSEDELFINVDLPDGWKKEAKDHAMWSNLKDSHDRIRATIFYKAAFYDRDSFINFNHRITYKVDRLLFLENNYSQDESGEYYGYSSPYVGRVKDFDGSILFETEKRLCMVEYNKPNRSGGYTESYKEQSSAIEKELKQQCLKFLSENYPDFENIHAYWNLP